MYTRNNKSLSISQYSFENEFLKESTQNDDGHINNNATISNFINGINCNINEWDHLDILDFVNKTINTRIGNDIYQESNINDITLVPPSSSTSGYCKQTTNYNIPQSIDLQQFPYKESLHELINIIKSNSSNTEQNSGNGNLVGDYNKKKQQQQPSVIINNDTYPNCIDMTPLKINSDSCTSESTSSNSLWKFNNYALNNTNISNQNGTNGSVNNLLSLIDNKSINLYNNQYDMAQHVIPRKYSDPTNQSTTNINPPTYYYDQCASESTTNTIKHDDMSSIEYDSHAHNQVCMNVPQQYGAFYGKAPTITNHVWKLMNNPPYKNQNIFDTNLCCDNFNSNQLSNDFIGLSQKYRNSFNRKSSLKNNINIGVYVNDLNDLFERNSKTINGKHILEINSENELFDYISKYTFYGSSIEATNINKILNLGLDKQELILIIKRWLLYIFSNEYRQLKHPDSNFSNNILNSDNVDNNSRHIHDGTDDKFSSFSRLKNIINLYETFIKNIDIIKTILYGNNFHINNYDSANQHRDCSLNVNETRKQHLDPLFVQFTINSYNEYNHHKASKFTNKLNHTLSSIRTPTIVNCLVYVEKSNDIKMFMLNSDNGALPDLIIMNLPHLWSREGKQFVCHICENFYTRKYGLKIHLRTHNSNKPLECKVCKKTFRDPSNLVKHSKIHNKTNNTVSDNYIDRSHSDPNNYNQKDLDDDDDLDSRLFNTIVPGANTNILSPRKRASSFIRH